MKIDYEQMRPVLSVAGTHQRRRDDKGHPFDTATINGRDRFHLRMVALGLHPEYEPKHRASA